MYLLAVFKFPPLAHAAAVTVLVEKLYSFVALVLPFPPKPKALEDPDVPLPEPSS